MSKGTNTGNVVAWTATFDIAPEFRKRIHEMAQQAIAEAKIERDLQPAVDTITELIESLIADAEYDSIRAILETFNPTRHPVEVSIALLAPIARERLWPASRTRASMRLIEYMRAIGKDDAVPLVERWAK